MKKLLLALLTLTTTSSFAQTYGDSLHRAIIDGNTEVAIKLINAGINVHAKDKLNDTPLNWAADYCRLEVVQLLIEKGADVNVRGHGGHTPLIDATLGNSKDYGQCLTTMKTLILNSANPNIQAQGGWTALHLVSNIVSLPKLKLLVEAGADVNIKGGNESNTALHFAVLSSHPAVEYLLEHGADPWIKNGFNRNALEQAKNDLTTHKYYRYREKIYGTNNISEGKKIVKTLKSYMSNH
jgi:ankyrin repeat protein